jgi:hypothetical protein
VLANKYSNKHNIYETIHGKCYRILTIVLTRSGNGSSMSGVSKINNKRHQRLISVTLRDTIAIIDF